MLHLEQQVDATFKPSTSHLPGADEGIEILQRISPHVPARYALSLYKGCTYNCVYCPANYSMHYQTLQQHPITKVPNINKDFKKHTNQPLKKKTIEINQNVFPLLNNILQNNTIAIQALHKGLLTNEARINGTNASSAGSGGIKKTQQAFSYANSSRVSSPIAELIPPKSLVSVGLGVQDIFMPPLPSTKPEGFEKNKFLKIGKIALQNYAAVAPSLILELLNINYSVVVFTKNPQALSKAIKAEQNYIGGNISGNKLTKLQNLTLICSLPFASSTNKNYATLEAGTPTPENRLKAMAFLHQFGITLGVAYMPIVLGINSSNTIAKETFQRAKKCGVSFALLGSINQTGLANINQNNNRNTTQMLSNFSPASREKCEQQLLKILHEIKLLPCMPYNSYAKKLSPRSESIAYLKQCHLLSSYRKMEMQGFSMAATSLEEINDQKFLKLLKDKQLQTLHGIGIKIERTLEKLLYNRNWEQLKMLQNHYLA